MARYAISPEGANQLKQLSASLLNCVFDILDKGSVLTKQISVLDETLGIYSNEIREIVRENFHSIKRSQDDITKVCYSLNSQADEIMQLCQDDIFSIGNSVTTSTITGHDISNSFCTNPTSIKSPAQQAGEQQNYLGLPTICNSAQFNEAVVASGFIAYRTLNAGNDIDSGIPRSSEEFAAQFESGESFSLNGSGQQVYGSGIYVASNSGWAGGGQPPSEEDRKNAEIDSSEYGHGEYTTLALTIAPDAKIGNYQELFSEYCSLSEREQSRFGGYGRDGIAAYAISKGYDGLRIPNAGMDCDYTVLYNRTKIILKQRQVNGNG